MASVQTKPRTVHAPARVETPPAPPQPAGAPARLVSLDAYRGFIMLVMASGGFGFARVAAQSPALAAGAVGLAGAPGGPLLAASNLAARPPAEAPHGWLWEFLAYQFDHVPWVGCSFWDLIQPSFLFMVGVALPYSVASRRAKGDSYGKMLAHAVWRSLLLILLAVFLSSPAALPRGLPAPEGPTTNWVFTNVLAQIGLAYVSVFLLAGRGWRVQLGAAAGIITAYTIFFGLYTAPAPGADLRAVGVPADWPRLTGWFAHWEKNANAAHAFDLWFLNLFPRPEPFAFNPGGYQTLNFVPSLATMILGLMAGEMLRGPGSPARKCAKLALAAVACLAAGWLLGLFVCPIVKRLWTPSWAVFSAGWTFALLAAFFWVIDVRGWRRWAWPLVVVGMNSIAMYVMAQLLKPWAGRALRTHLGRHWFEGYYGPVVLSAGVLLVLWLMCLWLYRRKIFLRI